MACKVSQGKNIIRLVPSFLKQLCLDLVKKRTQDIPRDLDCNSPLFGLLTTQLKLHIQYIVIPSTKKFEKKERRSPAATSAFCDWGEPYVYV